MVLAGHLSADCCLGPLGGITVCLFMSIMFYFSLGNELNEPKFSYFQGDMIQGYVTGLYARICMDRNLI